jgi:hypothetical protein
MTDKIINFLIRALLAPAFFASIILIAELIDSYPVALIIVSLGMGCIGAIYMEAIDIINGK